LESLEESTIGQQTVPALNLLPAPKCQAYISIFEDALDQLAVLGDIVPEIYKGNDKPASLFWKLMIVAD
jgi:hypothetical protein